MSLAALADRGRLGTKTDAAAEGISEQQYVRVIVLTLARGMKDTHIAGHLGIGLRTLVRYVAEAMAAVGARSRFEWAYLTGLAIGEETGRRDALAAMGQARRHRAGALRRVTRTRP